VPHTGQIGPAVDVLSLPHADPHHLLDAARELVPLLRDNSADADRLGRLPDRVAEALYRAGFLSLQVPRGLGGPQADFRTAFDVYVELGRGCGASAWVAMVLSGGSFMASLLGERAREELWGEGPTVAVCSQLTTIGTARLVDAGLVVSGCWRPVSGVHLSRWAMVAVSTDGAAGEGDGVSLAVVPVRDGRIESSWQVTGLRATGGDTLIFDEVFVPGHRVVSLAKMAGGGYGEAHPDEPLCGATVITALVVTIAAPLLGMAQAALEYVLERLGAASSGGHAALRRADSASVQFAVADAASLIDTARLRLHRALDDIEHGIGARSQLDALAQARVHMDAATAANSLREAVRLLLSAQGSAGFASANPVQRIWRDMEIALAHAAIAPDGNREEYGRALLGLGESEQ
jgi:3-hydroxy-9,10-secoandrosta-1,3,5(10)-triene-9,17-dione monooxygenase